MRSIEYRLNDDWLSLSRSKFYKAFRLCAPVQGFADLEPQPHNRIGSSASGSGVAAPIDPIRINKPQSMPARSAPRRRRVWCWRLALGTVPRSKRATTAPVPWTSISFAPSRGVRVPGRHLALQHGRRSKEPSLACLSLEGQRPLIRDGSGVSSKIGPRPKPSLTRNKYESQETKHRKLPRHSQGRH